MVCCYSGSTKTGNGLLLLWKYQNRKWSVVTLEVSKPEMVYYESNHYAFLLNRASGQPKSACCPEDLWPSSAFDENGKAIQQTCIKNKPTPTRGNSGHFLIPGLSSFDCINRYHQVDFW